jgi:hypothetical protein
MIIVLLCLPCTTTTGQVVWVTTDLHDPRVER